MSEPKAQEQEPSMEEILASIRRIISEDGGDEGEKAEVGAKPKRPAKPEAVAGAATPEPAGDNVLELTRVVQDDGSVVNLKDARSEAEEEIEVAGEPEPEPEPEPELEPEPEPEPVMATPPPAAMAPARSAGTLLSQETAAASGAAFAQLARMVQVSDEPLRVSARGRTIEDIVVEMLRPLLKDWLDTNLPPLVERLVKSEIERIVQGQGGRAL